MIAKVIFLHKFSKSKRTREEFLMISETLVFLWLFLNLRLFYKSHQTKVIAITDCTEENYTFAENLEKMSKISWSEFIIVWLSVCIFIDIVLLYLNRNRGTKEDSVAEERKAKIKQLNTPYRDDVVYETQLRRASMRNVEALAPIEETLPKETAVECEVEDQVELTELQQETSDIVKMLFG